MDLSMKMLREIPSVISHHWKNKTLNWPMIIYTSIVHSAAVAGAMRLTSCSAETLLFAFLLWPLSGFGITVGVHRLWSHRSYTASFPLRAFLMLCNSFANQGSIFHWARDHRVHHKFSETEADPHNATRGFFFAHMGWLFVKKDPAVVKAGKDLDFSDLLEDPIVMFQKKLDPWFAIYCCFVLPGQVAAKCWREEFWNGFFVAGALRYVFVLHATWLVNSAAHLYGDHPYDVLSYPSENPFVSYVSVGEGWHNWHHKYPFDYAASEYGVLRQFNPTKLVIDVCAALGLVSERKRATGMWTREKMKRSAAAKAA